LDFGLEPQGKQLIAGLESPIVRWGVMPCSRKGRIATPAQPRKKLTHLLRWNANNAVAGAGQCYVNDRYATTDLETKRKPIKQAHAIEHTTEGGAALWRTDASIWRGLKPYEAVSSSALSPNLARVHRLWSAYR
jgi:hypothetical protein